MVSASTPYDMREDLVPKRLTIAMWDYSWIYMHYEGGAFENWDKRIGELKERGFNTVRIDAMPMIIGKLKTESDFITLSGGPLRNWGASDKDRKHQVVNELIEFMTLAKKHGIHVILSTWNHSCLEFPGLREVYGASRKDYWNAWDRTLSILRRHDLLDHVVYVDLDQEFPYFSPFKAKIDQWGKQARASGNDMEQAGQIQEGFAWNQDQLDYVRSYLDSSLKHFQWLYPELRFTFSFTSFWNEIRSLKIRSFDVLELHLWMTQMSRFQNRSGFDDLTKNRGDHDYSDYMRRIDATMKSVRPMLLKEMHNRLKFAREWAEEVAAPLTTSEAWGPWWHGDHEELEWQWLYDWCEQSMALSSEYGFWGSTPWNFSHPYWKNWEEIEWYQRVNNRFLNDSDLPSLLDGDQ